MTSSTPLLIELPPNAKRHDSIALIIGCLDQTTIELSTSRLRSLDDQTKMTLTIVSNDESLQRSIHALIELHATLSAPHGVPIALQCPHADLLAYSSGTHTLPYSTLPRTPPTRSERLARASRRDRLTTRKRPRNALRLAPNSDSPDHPHHSRCSLNGVK